MAAERSDMETLTRPELIGLSDAARQRVQDRLAAQDKHCAACAGTVFDVGDALYLGFLFLDEDEDAYMVALTCRTQDCARPRTGMVLHGSGFLQP
jgi:hypothetical protein